METNRNSENVDTQPKKKKLKLNYEGTKSINNINISDLPYNVILKIFQYLDFKSVVNCANLCKIFYKASNDCEIYKSINLKYNLDNQLLDLYISKTTCPSFISIEYKVIDNNTEDEDDYTTFDNSIERLIRKCGSFLKCIHFESCKNDYIFTLLSECPNLEDARFIRCRGTFKDLPTLQALKKIYFVNSDIPNNIFIETLRNNCNLKTLWLSDNITNFKVNEICENMAKYNNVIEEVHFCERKKVRAAGIKALARCSKLKVLELIGGPLQCDPEDSFEQLAAGCPLLQRLTINGWKEVNDDNLMPIFLFCTKLKHLDLRGLNITIKFCKEALLSLPLLQKLDVYKCDRIKTTQLTKLQQSYHDIHISSQNFGY